MTLIKIYLILLIAATIIWVWCVYQMKRGHAIFDIRVKWIIEGDKRQYKYSYKIMFGPSLINWFMFRYPNEKHWKYILFSSSCISTEIFY